LGVRDFTSGRLGYRATDPTILASMRLLIADDDPSTLRLLHSTLEAAGHDVIACTDGTTALAALADGVRLAILDWEMPGVTGLEICRALQLETAERRPYTIILTAKDWDQSIDVAFDAGACDFIAKPFRRDDVLARVRIGERALRMQARLYNAESQRLESIGRLAAGIAHEINTPTQYVGDNVRFLATAFGGLTRILTLQSQALQGSLPRPDLASLFVELNEVKQAVDLDFLLAEIPAAIDNSLEGITRITRIVRAMKDFSHPESEEKSPADLNRALESTLEISRNEWKYVATVVTNFDPLLPQVMCLLGGLNQAFLNLIVNAAHAIGDTVAAGGKKGTITVSTRRSGDWAEIRISDTGAGIPQAIRAKIFDPFFTTKEVGKGTGQGLSIARSVVVEKHGGEISYETVEGHGTTFTIRIPIDPYADKPRRLETRNFAGET
jgi:signal transduction histidine kinase